MALVPATTKISELSWATAADLEAFVACVGDKVAAIEKHSYSTINIAQAFADLTNVGSLLRVAFANAGHKPCSAPIAKIIARYQELIHDSALTTQAFVTACVGALKNHKMAIMAAEKGRPDAALKMIVKCGNLALEMAALADGLVQKAAELSALSEEGLVQAVENRAMSKQEADRVRDLIHKTQAQTKQLTTLKEEIAEEIDMACADEMRHANTADAARKQQMFTQILSAGIKIAVPAVNPLAALGPSTAAPATPAKGHGDRARDAAADATANAAIQEALTQKKQLTQEKTDLEGEIAGLAARMANCPEDQKAGYASDIKAKKEQKEEKAKLLNAAQETLSGLQASLGAKAKSAEEMEAKALEKKYELMRAKRQANADLQGKLEELKGMKVSHDDLEKAVKALEVVIVTMGRVKTTFTNVRVFWDSVAKHCHLLSKGKENIEFLKEIEGSADDMKQEIAGQAINWAALGRVNMVAHSAMVQSAESVDELMQNLPVGSEAAVLQDEVISRLTKALTDEDKDLALLEAGKPK